MTQFGVFQRFGVELEYMIVDRETLEIMPIADRVLQAANGSEATEVERGPIAWSNELVLHVLELKTNGPAPRLDGLHYGFQADVVVANKILEPFGAALLPTGMHPWMDPHTQSRLWPHEYNEVYRTFDRIFGCKGHGWSNLQSAHLNLPFNGDREFAALHDAIRVVLPVIPALTASSPYADGRLAGPLDFRLAVYGENSLRVPSVTGGIIPERVKSEAEYCDTILRRIYDDLAPFDPEGVLRHEWANARGAIARFERGAIEIRVVDTQECPRADIAVLALITEAVRYLTDIGLESSEKAGPLHSRIHVDALKQILADCILDGDEAVIDYGDYLAAFGLDHKTTAGGFWARMAERAGGDRLSEWKAPLETIFDQGCLARRIKNAAGDAPDRGQLVDVYARLRDCLAIGESFGA